MSAEQRPSSLVQGTLHMLILKTLALEPTAIARIMSVSPGER